jgi:hypothetical protein
VQREMRPRRGARADARSSQASITRGGRACSAHKEASLLPSSKLRADPCCAAPRYPQDSMQHAVPRSNPCRAPAPRGTSAAPCAPCAPATGPPNCRSFVAACLQKDAAIRPSASELMSHAFIAEAAPRATALASLVDEYGHRRRPLPLARESSRDEYMASAWLGWGFGSVAGEFQWLTAPEIARMAGGSTGHAQWCALPAGSITLCLAARTWWRLGMQWVPSAHTMLPWFHSQCTCLALAWPCA